MKLKNIFLTVLTVFILMQTAYANVKTEYRTAYGIIEVKGNIDSQSIVAGKYVTLLLYGSDGELCHIGQVDVKRDGSYEYAFAVANYTDNMNLKIKAGDCDITETLSQAIYKNSALEYINYGIHEIDSSTAKVVIDLSRIKKYCSDFEVVIAVYDGTEVKNTIVKNSSDLKNKKIMSEVVPNGDEIKVFVWDSFRNVMPFGITKKYDTDTEISFGEAADAVYDNGFAALEGNDVYSRYQSAVEEIPEEYPTLSLMENRSLNSFYVSPGASRGMGTIDKPFGSISEAINAYNLLSDDEKSWWTSIVLLEGCYPASDFNCLLSVNGDARLYITAFDNQKVVVSGAKETSGLAFKKVTSENTSADVLARINPEATDELYYAEYNDFGITSLNEFRYGNRGTVPILVYNGEQQMISRYPNSYDMEISEVVKNGIKADGNRDTDGDISFVPSENRPFMWDASQKITMKGQLSVSWYTNYMAADIDAENGTISTPVATSLCYDNANPSLYKLNKYLQNNPGVMSHYYFCNVFEEIDMPGEWCGDDNQQRIYFYPPKNISGNDSVKIEGTDIWCLLKLNNAENIVINGMDFEFAKNALSIVNCKNVVVQNCNFKYISDTSVAVSGNSKKCGVIYSEFNRVNRGVSFLKTVDTLKNLESEQCFVQNCHFNNMDGTCIYMENTVNNIISHNLAENHMTAFVSVFGGCENVIEYNESKAGVLQGNEGNNIYLDGEFVSRNNHIRYNYIHDNSPKNSDITLGYALAVDDMGENFYVYGNLFKNVSCGAYANGGDNNVFDKNTFIDCTEKFPIAAVDTMYGNYINTNISEQNRAKRYYVQRAFDTDGNNSFMKKYVNNDFRTAVKYNMRYTDAAARYDYYMNLAQSYTAGDESSESQIFARAVTGTYITNNTFVPASCENSILLNNRNNNFRYTVFESPNDGITKYDGWDYNTYYGNESTDSIEYGNIDKFEHMGMLNSAEYLNSTLRVTYPKNVNGIYSADRVNLAWTDVDSANYYKVSIALDDGFENIIEEKFVLESKFSCSRAKNKNIKYYYKVEAYKYNKVGEDTLIDSASGYEILK